MLIKWKLRKVSRNLNFFRSSSKNCWISPSSPVEFLKNGPAHPSPAASQSQLTIKNFHKKLNFTKIFKHRLWRFPAIKWGLHWKINFLWKILPLTILCFVAWNLDRNLVLIYSWQFHTTEFRGLENLPVNDMKEQTNLYMK
jgi:hypothetical protein